MIHSKINWIVFFNHRCIFILLLPVSLLDKNREIFALAFAKIFVIQFFDSFCLSSTQQNFWQFKIKLLTSQQLKTAKKYKWNNYCSQKMLHFYYMLLKTKIDVFDVIQCNWSDCTTDVHWNDKLENVSTKNKFSNNGLPAFSFSKVFPKNSLYAK